jgi:hypothetical protein
VRSCVCQIVELFVCPSTVSKHLSILNTGLIVSRKTAFGFTTDSRQRCRVAVRDAIDWVQKSLGGTPQAVADRKKLKQILKLDPRMICRRQLQR